MSDVLIQDPHAKVQIGRESDPEQVRDLQQRSRAVHFAERPNHPQNQNPQEDEPKQSQSVPLEIKKDDAPEEVHGQLKNVDTKTLRPLGRGRGQVNAGRPDAHQGKQNDPDDGKRKGGRRQGRLPYDLSVHFGARTGQPAGKGSHRFGKQDPEQIGFPYLFFHLHHPWTGYVLMGEFYAPVRHIDILSRNIKLDLSGEAKCCTIKFDFIF